MSDATNSEPLSVCTQKGTQISGQKKTKARYLLIKTQWETEVEKRTKRPIRERKNAPCFVSHQLDCKAKKTHNRGSLRGDRAGT